MNSMKKQITRAMLAESNEEDYGTAHKLVRDISPEVEYNDVVDRVTSLGFSDYMKLDAALKDKDSGTVYDLLYSKNEIDESLADFNSDDPMTSNVVIPGYGSMTVSTLMANVGRTLDELAKMPDNIDKYRKVNYELYRKYSVLQAKLDALVTALDDLQEIRKKGGTRSRNIQAESNGEIAEGNLPPHLAKFFNKEGNLNPDAEERVRKGREERSRKGREERKTSSWKDVTPKGYGPDDEQIDEYGGATYGKSGRYDRAGYQSPTAAKKAAQAQSPDPTPYKGASNPKTPSSTRSTTMGPGKTSQHKDDKSAAAAQQDADMDREELKRLAGITHINQATTQSIARQNKR
jgi:hypothetical protein